MTILPKKDHSSSKNNDGTHAVVDRAHHGPVVHMQVQRRENGRMYVAQSGAACWESLEDKRAGVHDADVVDGPSHVKRRHRDAPSHMKQRIGPVSGACGGPSCSQSSDDVAIAGPSGFNPKPKQKSLTGKPVCDDSDGDGEAFNSDDEYERIQGEELTEDAWQEREKLFEKLLKKKKLVIKQTEQDGACLFRAVAVHIYGDQEMHGVVRNHCMDYIAKNADFFSGYVTEDFESYVARKRLNWVHGNNIEIQALSEMYNRPIEVYSYSSEPINTFHGEQVTDNPPIRLSYHRNVHYNAIVDPWAPTVGIGLGLPEYKPGAAEKSLVHDALHQSETTALEQAMLEDKLKATDWEATDEAIEEQVARESYLQWLKDNEHRRESASKQAAAAAGRSAAAVAASRAVGLSSPKPGTSSRLSPDARQTPEAAAASVSNPSPKTRKSDGFDVEETASFLNNLPPEMFGLSDFEDNDSILARVLAASQEEYLNSLKLKKKDPNPGSPSELREEDDDEDEDGGPSGNQDKACGYRYAS
ncbi:unnamed protein product [Notodromas monacha]|uniref:ubiquitinyl hydrolase 1 n=1 Tax=Notodromas monacha TaxID=399045 RepID=A0A7R9BS52_9CRUS|nr:unnamed protein product [Notodromas monacha]CAG0920686.1 unnamed protein product [Notodromas monacha]